MDVFQNAHDHDKYLTAEDDEESVSQDRNGSSQSSKKKRSQSSKKRSRRRSKSKQVKKDTEKNQNDEKMNCLVEAFNSISLDEVRLAYNQAYGDVNKAAKILGGLDDRVVSCSSEMGGSCSLSTSNSEIFGSSSEIFGSSSDLEMHVENKSGSVVGVVKAKTKKKIVSSIGQMSLGDFYLSSTKKGTDQRKNDVEQVRDTTSVSTYHPSESEPQDTVWPINYKSRSYVSALVGSEAASASESPASFSAENSESELPQKVLESLFSTPKSSEHKLGTANWRNVAKKMKPRHAKGDEYQVCRELARQHWDLKKLCNEEASISYSKGERDYAAYMSEKGRTHDKIAREADEKASQYIFHLRNASIENVVTFDLHGQHVKPALEILKKNLTFGAIAGTVQLFRVITGRGAHSMGKSKLKQSVINLLQEESIRWAEENAGVLLIWLDGRTEFAFLDAYS